MQQRGRYRHNSHYDARYFARCYDLLSAEWPVYRAGRVAAFNLLGLHAGDRVLDIGAGTGLNFSPLQRLIGPTGSITAIDASPQMLRQARRRTVSAGWGNVRLITADATTLSAATVRDGGGVDTGFDAVLSTYALSLMPNWPRAVSLMIDAARPGGRVAVVDMQKPVGRAAAWSPLARLACRLGGSDIDAHPWTAIESTLTGVQGASLRGGHVQVRVGSVPG